MTNQRQKKFRSENVIERILCSTRFSVAMGVVKGKEKEKSTINKITTQAIICKDGNVFDCLSIFMNLF